MVQPLETEVGARCSAQPLESGAQPRQTLAPPPGRYARNDHEQTGERARCGQHDDQGHPAGWLRQQGAQRSDREPAHQTADGQWQQRHTHRGQCITCAEPLNGWAVEDAPHQAERIQRSQTVLPGALRRSATVEPPVSPASRMRSLLQKPFMIGTPARARAPTMNTFRTSGIRAPRPPSRARSRVPVAWMTAPAARNSSALNSAWLSRWNWLAKTAPTPTA